MFTHIRAAVRPTLSLLALFTVLTGLAYPLVMTAIAQLLMPAFANGSMISQNGHIIGSRLIGQNFAQGRYFHGRPSAAGKTGYDASGSTGSNYAPGAKALADRIGSDVASLRKEGITGPIPADIVTTSGSGLDPDISPAAALVQAPRIARLRGLDEAGLRQLIASATQQPLLGLIGEPRVNVLLINLQMDRAAANRQSDTTRRMVPR